MSKYLDVRNKLIQLEDKGQTDTEEYKELGNRWRELRSRGI